MTNRVIAGVSSKSAPVGRLQLGREYGREGVRPARRRRVLLVVVRAASALDAAGGALGLHTFAYKAGIIRSLHIKH